ncbi:MAG: hypothetical protein ACREDM_14545 [Methylocella sp.]
MASARKLVGYATTMVGVSLNEDASRMVYLAGFHAVRAFIFETAQKAFKSYRAVRRSSCV